MEQNIVVVEIVENENCGMMGSMFPPPFGYLAYIFLHSAQVISTASLPCFKCDFEEKR